MAQLTLVRFDTSVHIPVQISIPLQSEHLEAKFALELSRRMGFAMDIQGLRMGKGFETLATLKRSGARVRIHMKR